MVSCTLCATHICSLSHTVSDALEYSPEKCTVVATYKQLVVGAAFLSSPQETYITYLAVRAGWDNSQIATSVLFRCFLGPSRADGRILCVS